MLQEVINESNLQHYKITSITRPRASRTLMVRNAFTPFIILSNKFSKERNNYKSLFHPIVTINYTRAIIK